MNLLILLLIPLVSSLLALMSKKAAKHLALIASLASLALSIFILCNFVPDGSRQHLIDLPWIPEFGIRFRFGLDGISMLMVLLTTGLFPLIILSSYKRNITSASFYALIQFMQFGLLVVFSATDAFVFYVGWEAALIPIYFICSLWGGENKVSVNMKFFIYTIAGSLFMLIAIVLLHLNTPDKSFSIESFYRLNLPKDTQSYIFWCFFLAFAIKMPIFPFHTWQPDTYTTAPTTGTMLLSGIMLKMGVYGAIRWLIPVSPLGFLLWGKTALILSIIGILYASVIAFKQTDIKRLIAYSSIAHVGLIAAGVFTWNMKGLQGSMIQMINHGINVVGLFLVAEIISEQLKTREIPLMGGLAKTAPKLAIYFLIILLGTVALPLTNGFIGEFLLLNSLYHINIWYAALAGLTIIFGAVYMLRAYKGVMQGNLNELTANFRDVSGTDAVVLFSICTLIIAIGIYPQAILHISEASVQKLIIEVNQKLAF